MQMEAIPAQKGRDDLAFWHRMSDTRGMAKTFLQRFVRAVYADHNDSKAVTRVLTALIDAQGPDALMLNIGGGSTRLHPRMKTLEIEAGPGIDYVGTAESLPFADGAVDLIVTQEVLEHVADPFQSMREIHRVLKPGGRAYVQLPFIIGYHPCPEDFWRFTERGIRQLAEQAGFVATKADQSVGPATGFYRIAVEFGAILFSRPLPRLYKPAKGGFALLLYPLKWLDGLLIGHPEADRIAGGYFVEVVKGG